MKQKLISLLTLLVLCVTGAWADDIKTFTFDDGVSLDTDWDVTKDIPSGGSAVCEITSSLSGAGFSPKSEGNNYLGLSYLNKGGVGITITTKTSFSNILEISIDAVAGDNGKPTFAAYIVTESGDVEVFAAVGSKAGFSTGSTNKWGNKTVELAEPKTGKLKIVTTASSSDKYAALDNIKITYADTPTITYSVTYKANGSGESDEVDDKATTIASNPFTYAGYRFTGWNTASGGEGTDYAVGDAVTSNLTLFAQWEEIVYYTVTLNPNGGTIDDATGWTLDNGLYKKTGVAIGTELELPTFTKADRTLLNWRDDSDNEYTSPVTVNSNLAITAIWGKEKETTIYSWESPSGTPIETGGTATHFNNASAVVDNARVNYSNTVNDVTYYTISLNGKADYTDNHIRIALTNNIKTGDMVKVTAYCTNSDNSKNAGPRMDTQDGTTIFAQTSAIVNIYSSGSPTLYTYIVPAGINTDAVKLTRNLTGTNTFITKLQIVRTEIVEEQDPCETPTIATQPVGADYEWSDVVAPMTVTASVSDGGTLSYQWYKKGSPDEEVGTNSASYTPAAAGTYYVVVTNSKDGYDDASVTSDDAVITITAQPTYEITFSAGEGSGTVPTEGAKVDGAEFTLPGQGNMVAPANTYFIGWNDGTDDYAEGDTYTMSDEAVTFTALWTALPVATANHYKYSYNDAQHYVNSTYRNPRGGIAASGDNQSIPNGNLCENLGGISTVAITSAQFDGKGTHMNAYLKIAKGGSAKVTITIADGYVGTLTLKANGYSANASILVSDAMLKSGEEGGEATIEDNFNTLVYTLPAGTHDITCDKNNMYISEMDIVTREVVTVTIPASKEYATFNCDKNLDFTDVTDIYAYTAKISGSTVTLTKVDGKVPANEGLLIRGASLGASADVPVAASASEVDNDFVAVTADEGVNLTSGYVLATVGGVQGFYPANTSSGTLVSKGKAYLPTGAGARLTMVFDDGEGGELTGISLNKREATATDRFFNLSGQRVAQPSKGLYIVNGKKVIVK